jgi:hypothetical protein
MESDVVAMYTFANFNTKKFGELALNAMQDWAEGSKRYKKPEMANANATLAMLTGMEAEQKSRGIRTPYRLRTIRDNTAPGRPVIGGAVVYKDESGQTILDGLASNPAYSSGNVLSATAKRFGSGLRAKNVFSDIPYKKAGWIQDSDGSWVAP